MKIWKVKEDRSSSYTAEELIGMTGRLNARTGESHENGNSRNDGIEIVGQLFVDDQMIADLRSGRAHRSSEWLFVKSDQKEEY